MKAKSLTAYQLKWFAAAMMLADHSYKIFLPQILMWMSGTFHMETTLCYSILTAFCGITTTSFFIFAFLCGESCRYTCHKVRYIKNLFLFAVVSELPFQLMKQAMDGIPLHPYWGFSNVLATLLLGVLACFGFEEASKRNLSWAGALLLLLCMGMAWLLQTDYHAYGVLAVFVSWFFKEKRQRLVALGAIIFLLYGIQGLLAEFLSGMDWYETPGKLSAAFFSMGTVWLLNQYGGKRGKNLKFFFYLFYPAHISLLVFLYVLLGH